MNHDPDAPHESFEQSNQPPIAPPHQVEYAVPPTKNLPSQVDDLDAGNIDSQGRRIHRKRREIYCFSCNRLEGHFLWKQHFWYYSFLTGLTFGFVKWIGPFQCQCCGHRRLMSANMLSPRYWYRKFVMGKASSGGRARKGKSDEKFRPSKWS
jgi:hypothetical protein